MIEAVIFDMDGLLIDSEPIWRDEEKSLFQNFGISITNEMHRETHGLATDELVRHWYSLKPWENISLAEVANQLLQNVEEQIVENGQLKEGVQYILEFFVAREIPIGLASSSPGSLIARITEKQNIRKYFNSLHSSETESHGKPHPAVYISAAKRLGIAPSKCLVFEDSLNGLIAAKAARMKTVAIPDPFVKNDERFAIADIRLNSLYEFNEEYFNFFNDLTK